LLEARVVRVLVPYSRTLYFIDGGKQRGLTADTLHDFEVFLNKKYHLKGPADHRGRAAHHARPAALQPGRGARRHRRRQHHHLRRRATRRSTSPSRSPRA